MNFYISKTLLFKINKCILNCIMISEKKIRVLMIRVKLSASPIILTLCLAVMRDGVTCLGQSAADAFGLFE